MTYTEKTADYIIKKHGLRKEIKKVWKTRSAIPEMYHDYKKRETIKDKAKAVEYQRLLNVLELKELNLNTLAKLANVSESKIADAKRQKVELSERDFLSLKIQIKKLKIEIVNTFKIYSAFRFRNLLKNGTIKHSMLLKHIEIGLVDRVKNGKKDMTKELYIKIKQEYTILGLQLNI